MVQGNSFVLIVEGDENERDAVESVLTHFGLRVRTAGTMPEAAEQLRHCPPCVLIDAELPSEAAVHILKWLRSGARVTKVAIMTSRFDSSARYKGPFKPDAIFRKPVDALELISWIRSASADILNLKQTEAYPFNNAA